MTTALTLHLTDDLDNRLKSQAEARGVSTADYVAQLLMLHVGEDGPAAFFAARAARADLADFERVFSPDRPGGEPPRPGDELP